MTFTDEDGNKNPYFYVFEVANKPPTASVPELTLQSNSLWIDHLETDVRLEDNEGFAL